MTKKARFELSQDVERCRDFLRSRDRATFYELSQHLGRDVAHKDRYVLTAARRLLEREGVVFVAETGKGVVRANDAQVAELSTDAAIDGVKRRVVRAKKRQAVVNIQGLTAEQRIAFNLGTAILGAIGQATRLAFKNKVKKATNPEDGPLPIAKTLALFGKLKPNGEDLQ